MKTGDIVYLCEDDFIKFRNLHQFMLSSDNIYKKDILFKSNFLVNEFVIIATCKKINEAIIVFRNENFDNNIALGVAYNVIKKLNIESSFQESIKDKISFCNKKSIRQICNFIYNSIHFPARKNLFTVKLDNLTLLFSSK